MTSRTVSNDFCDECGRMKPVYGVVNVHVEPGFSRRLCAQCYNADYMKRAGLPPLESVDFDPIVRHGAAGQARTFYFVVHLSNGLGIRAFELVKGEPGGYQFVVLEPLKTPVRTAYAKLLRKIEAGIAVRYLNDAEPHFTGTALIGRIDENEKGPVVVIDGREFTWEAFGRIVSVSMGFNFRLEIFDPSEDPAITPDPQRHARGL